MPLAINEMLGKVQGTDARRLLRAVLMLSAVLLGSNAARAENITYPIGAGHIDITQPPYNATPNGGTDDTAAIQNAIDDYLDESTGRTRTIYFPNGRYDVSDTIYWRKYDQSGNSKGWGCYLRLQGQSRAGTIIKLADNLSPFNDPDATVPYAVFYTASRYDGTSGFDPVTGGGNKAFRNSICNMTIDIGANNPSAAGVDYLANNLGALREVTIKTSDTSKRGYAGIVMNRGWPGPALIKNVSIDGFKYGIEIKQNQYSMTLEQVTLTNQNTAGIRNVENVLTISQLTSNNQVPVILSEGTQAQVALNVGRFTGTGAASTAYAVNNVAGRMWVRKTTCTGYKKPILNRGTEVSYVDNSEWVSDGPFTQSTPMPAPALSLNLAPSGSADTPAYFDTNHSNWVAVNNTGTDQTTAIEAALATAGKTTVYFPSGRYAISRTITIPSTIRHIVGMGSYIGLTATNTFGNAASPQPMFKVEGSNALLIEDLNLNGTVINGNPMPGAIVIRHAGTGTLTLRDVSLGSKKYAFQNQAPSSGTLGVLFIENVMGSPWRFEAPQEIWARQFNVEFAQEPMIYNNGCKLRILGLKTEGGQTVIKTVNNGQTELNGGFLYPNSSAAPTTPAFICENSRMSLTFVAKSDTTSTNYQILTQELRNGVTLTWNAGASTRFKIPLFIGY